MVSIKKFFSVDVKSADDGSFSGILSTYGNVDRVGDICEYGCFDDSIAAKGTHYPLLWNHRDDEPIGSFDVVNSEANLSIKGKFNMGVARAREIHSLMKAGDVNGLSIGYIPVKFVYDQNGIRHLQEVELFEGSVTAFPANTLASAEAKKMNENFVAFKSAMVQVLKRSGKSDDEIAKLVEETEKRCKEDEEQTEKKEEEKPEDGEATDKPAEKPADEKGENESSEDEKPLFTDEEVATLKKLCKDVAEEREKLKEEMKA